MRRRSNKTTQILLYVISFLVIAGMLCGVLALIFAPDSSASLLPGLTMGLGLI
jgi:phosphotransferase system  glucose/maltose/N-acetylglucosamine-specific IIC component